MRAVSSAALAIVTLARSLRAAPCRPVRTTTASFSRRAVSIPARTFAERPLVVIATATSPGVPWASSWREKICSKPLSFAIEVRVEPSVVSAIAGSAPRSRRKRPTSSLLRCCASLALPPFPKQSTLPPAVSASTISWAAAAVCAANPGSSPAAAALSRSAAATAAETSVSVTAAVADEAD